MRGERENMLSFFRAAIRGDATPNTPSTTASSRQNPLNYQRMHSNESDKEKDSGRTSDWLDVTPSGNANGASKLNSSPNQNQKWITTLPSGGRINKYMQSQFINDAKSVSNPKLDTVDGVANERMVNNLDARLTDGVMQNNGFTNKNRQNVTNKTDDDTAKNSNIKSDDNKNTIAINRSEDSSVGSVTSLNDAIDSDQNPAGSNSTFNLDDNNPSSTTSSAQLSLTDNSENSDSKRTLLNKYVKKVRNFMKKWSFSIF